MYGEDRKYPIPCVSAFILDRNGRVLVTKRSNTVFFPGVWCLPGGHVNGGCDWEETLINEVKEEVGLRVIECKLIGIYSDPKLNHMEEPTTKKMRAYANALFMVTKFEGTVSINDEVAEFGWYTLQDLPQPFLECERVKTVDGFSFTGSVFVK